MRRATINRLGLLLTVAAVGGCGAPGAARTAAIPVDECVAPARPAHFPDSAGTFLVTPTLGFTPQEAAGHYELLVVKGADSGQAERIRLQLERPRSSADAEWIAQVQREVGRAPTLLGTSELLQTVIVPSNGYVIIGPGGYAVQADVTPAGALVFTLGDHLYGATSTVFQTTVRDGRNWRGWWWYPGWRGRWDEGHGYFCLRRS